MGTGDEASGRSMLGMFGDALALNKGSMFNDKKRQSI